MSIYMTRLFSKSNSSFHLSGGNVLKAQVSRLRDKMFLVDSGVGTPRMCMQEELTRVPAKSTTTFENKIEFVDSVANETQMKKRDLERFFVDLVAGDPIAKDRATAKFNDMAGSSEVVPGEPHLILPRRYRQKLALIELNQAWRTNTPVKGFLLGKVRQGYSVAVGGYVATLPFRRLRKRSRSSDRYIIERINTKKDQILVL